MIQGFDFIEFKSNACGYYTYNTTCMSFASFVANKAIRLALNCTLLWLLQWRFYKMYSNLFMMLILGLIFLGALDVFFLQEPIFFAQRLHQFLHPIVFSPLLAIIVLAFMLVPQKQ
ncbi:MAG: hypothetical protein CFE21_11425 [Bacteroidetes bacterium B1(2017)]|nr:MAG: hypothetical protein CFE21_11425 [Bacteroidetes bacterium B1(2017)]